MNYRSMTAKQLNHEILANGFLPDNIKEVQNCLRYFKNPNCSNYDNLTTFETTVVDELERIDMGIPPTWGEMWADICPDCRKETKDE